MASSFKKYFIAKSIGFQFGHCRTKILIGNIGCRCRFCGLRFNTNLIKKGRTLAFIFIHFFCLKFCLKFLIKLIKFVSCVCFSFNKWIQLYNRMMNEKWEERKTKWSRTWNKISNYFIQNFNGMDRQSLQACLPRIIMSELIFNIAICFFISLRMSVV